MRRSAVSLLVILVALVILSSCAPDPRDQAEADRIRAMTQVTATAAAIEAQAAAADLAHQQQMQAEREALYREAAQAAAERAELAIRVLSIAGILTGVAMLVGLGYMTLRAQVAAARVAEAKAAQVEATLAIIQPGQAPLVLLKTGKLLNAATGQVFDPHQALPADKQQVLALSAAQIAAILAGSAEKIARHPQSTAADILPAIGLNLPDPGMAYKTAGEDETLTGPHQLRPSEDIDDALQY